MGCGLDAAWDSAGTLEASSEPVGSLDPTLVPLGSLEHPSGPVGPLGVILGAGGPISTASNLRRSSLVRGVKGGEVVPSAPVVTGGFGGTPPLFVVSGCCTCGGALLLFTLS